MQPVSLFKPIVLRCALLTILVLLAIYFYASLTKLQVSIPLLLLITLVPPIFNLLFMYKLIGILKLSHNVFFRKYLLFNGIKFLLNLFTFLALIFVLRFNPLPFIIVYLLSYFIFFVHELVEIQGLIRKTKNQ